MWAEAGVPLSCFSSELDRRLTLQACSEGLGLWVVVSIAARESIDQAHRVVACGVVQGRAC
jgi:hypothetical protein